MLLVELSKAAILLSNNKVNGKLVPLWVKHKPEVDPRHIVTIDPLKLEPKGMALLELE